MRFSDPAEFVLLEKKKAASLKNTAASFISDRKSVGPHIAKGKPKRNEKTGYIGNERHPSTPSTKFETETV